MDQNVALVEGAPDPERDPGQLVQRQQMQPRQSLDVTAGGATGKPVVQIPTSGGSIELGYEDIFLMLLAVDVGFRVLSFVRGRRS